MWQPASLMFLQSAVPKDVNCFQTTADLAYEVLLREPEFIAKYLGVTALSALTPLLTCQQG
jgi:hypothetical protein